MRILFVGYCNDVYVGYLASIIKRQMPDSYIGVIDLVARGNELDNKIKNNFDKTYLSNSNKNYNLSLSQKVQIAFNYFTKINIKWLLKNLFTFKFKSVYHKLFQLYITKCHRSYIKEIFNDFNPTHVHFHFLNQSTLSYLYYIPENVKVILTFWGSDLMNTSGTVQEYEIQLAALERADTITTHSLESRTILLSKFGQKFLSKIKIALFDPLYQKTDLLNFLMNNSNTDDIKRKLKISLNKVLVQIGYSAAESQQHLKILGEFKNLPLDTKQKLVLFIPLSYGGSSDYIEIVSKKVLETGIECLLQKEFLTDYEILERESVSDFLICVRESDVGNASLIEFIYLGKLVIAGSWLPYKMYEHAGIFFENVENIESLVTLIPKLVEDLNNVKLNCKNNKERLLSIYDSDFITKNWCHVYLD